MDDAKFSRCQAVLASVLKEIVTGSLADHEHSGRDALHDLRLATSKLILDQREKSGGLDARQLSVAGKLADEFFDKAEKMRKLAVGSGRSTP